MMQPLLAERLRVIRAQRGLTVVQAAEKIGIDRHTLRDLELGRRRPNFETMEKVAKGYGVSVGDLVEEGEPALSGKAEAPEEDEPELAAEEVRSLAEGIRATAYYPVATTTIAQVLAVCEGVEYRVEQEDYTLKGAMLDRVLVLETLGHFRALQRSLFKEHEAATSHQRETLDRLEGRLKAVRNKATEAYERLWNAEPDPDKVISLDDRRKLQALEQEVRELSTGAGGIGPA
jgi:transcriptional regulator with XRE-family HTH domain